MKSIHFIILAVICAVLAVIAAFTMNNSGGPSSPDEMAGKELLPDLPINDAASITITGPETSVRLVKGESVWEVADRYNYPADFGKITELAKNLKDMKAGRSFPADPDTRKRLALNMPDDKTAETEARGSRVIIKDKADKTLADLIVGNAREASAGSGGHYVAKTGEATIYLVDKSFYSLEKDAAKWLEKELLNVKAEDVREVVCLKSADNTEVYRLRRPEKGKEAEFVNLPDDMKPKTGDIQSAFSALMSLSLNDVADPDTPAETTGLKDGYCLKFYLFNGTIYTLCPGKAAEGDENNYYLTANVDYKAPPEPKAAPEAVAEETASDDKTAEKADANTAEPESKAPAGEPQKTSADADTSADKTAKKSDADTAEPEGKAPADESPDTSADKPVDKSDDEANDTSNDKSADKAKETEKKKEPEYDTAKLSADAKKLNDKLGTSIFMIPKWKVENLKTEADKLYEPIKEEKASEDSENPNTPIIKGPIMK